MRPARADTKRTTTWAYVHQIDNTGRLQAVGGREKPETSRYQRQLFDTKTLVAQGISSISCSVQSTPGSPVSVRSLPVPCLRRASPATSLRLVVNAGVEQGLVDIGLKDQPHHLLAFDHRQTLDPPSLHYAQGM